MNSLIFKNKLQNVNFINIYNYLQLFTDFYSIESIVNHNLFIENLELKIENKFNNSKIYNKKIIIIKLIKKETIHF